MTHMTSLKTIIIGIAVVNYHGTEDTVKLIHSISECELNNIQVKVQVIDNSVHSEQLELTEKTDKYRSQNINISVVHVKNSGYFRALNVGLQKLEELNSQYEYILVGNNDLLFSSNFFKELIIKQYDSDVFVIAPDIINKNGVHENPRAVRKISLLRKKLYKIYYSGYPLALIMTIFWRFFSFIRTKKNPYADKVQRIHLAVGACYILTEQFVINCRRLDDRVFLFGEEALLSNQVAIKGGAILYDPSLTVVHNEHSSVSMLSTYSYYKIQQESYRIYKDYL